MPRAVIREDRYQCPECHHWYGEHMNTRLLARHKEPASDPYTLCTGSLRSINGLPHQQAGLPAAPIPTDEQGTLFDITGDLLG